MIHKIIQTIYDEVCELQTSIWKSLYTDFDPHSNRSISKLYIKIDKILIINRKNLLNIPQVSTRMIKPTPFRGIKFKIGRDKT